MTTELPPAYSTLNQVDSTDATETENTAPSSENETETRTSFETKISQIGFIQKVLAIKLLQVMIVSAIEVALIFLAGGFFNISTRVDFEGYFRINCLIVLTLVFMGTAFSLSFSKKARTVAPQSYIFLVAYPVTFALFMFFLFFGFGIKSFMVSWLHFNIVVLVLLMYSVLALQTEIEFKITTSLYIAAGILIIAYPLTVPFTDRINPFKVFYFSVIMFLGTAFVLYDIESMMTTDYCTPITPSDFVKAAVLMHVDNGHIFKKIYNAIRDNKDGRSEGAEREKLTTDEAVGVV